jgi:hypothetical protein
MDKWIEEMYEASKLDHTVIVGSDIRQLTGEIARLTAALEEAKRERDEAAKRANEDWHDTWRKWFDERDATAKLLEAERHANRSLGILVREAEAALQSAEAKGYVRGVEEAIDAAPTQRRGVVETMLIARQALLDYASRTVDPDLRSGLAVLKALVPAPAVEPVATTTEKEGTDE